MLARYTFLRSPSIYLVFVSLLPFQSSLQSICDILAWADHHFLNVAYCAIGVCAFREFPRKRQAKGSKPSTNQQVDQQVILISDIPTHFVYFMYTPKLTMLRRLWRSTSLHTITAESVFSFSSACDKISDYIELISPLAAIRYNRWHETFRLKLWAFAP